MESTIGQPVIVTGVVHPSGAGGARLGEDPRWRLRFSLEPWRVEGAPLNEGALEVTKAVSEEDLRAFMKRIRPCDVVRLSVHFSGPEHTAAELLELLEVQATDPELSERAEALRQPVTRQDPFFGELTLDRRLDWWGTIFRWGTTPVQLYLSGDEEGSPEPALRAARSLWEEQPEWEKRVRDFAVEALLPLKNDVWLDDDEEPLTSEAFKERMTLQSITLYPDGSFDFFHDDGELFWGHAIQVWGTLSEGPTGADIPG